MRAEFRAGGIHQGKEVKEVKYARMRRGEAHAEGAAEETGDRLRVDASTRQQVKAPTRQ
jgi:hypothetical protein